MATPITPPVTDTPTARTAEGVGTTATPTARTAVTPATTAVPTARGAITPSTTPVPTARTSLTPATTATPTARSAVTPSSNPTPTAFGALSPVAALRTGGDVVNLDFCGESYNVDFDYSRASSGTYIDRNKNQFDQYDYLLKNDFVGDVENLVFHSEDFTNSLWTKTNTLITNKGVDKTIFSNFYLLSEVTEGTFRRLSQALNSASTNNGTFSILLKGITTLSCFIRLEGTNIGQSDSTSSTYEIKPFNGSVIGNTSGANDSDCSSFYVGNGWYRYSLKAKKSSTITSVILDTSHTISQPSNRVFISQAQYTESAKPLPYVKTLASAVTQAFTAIPRIGYDAATGKCLGYLAEGASTNLYTYSEDFTNAGWTKTQSSIVANNAIAPDGTFSASKLNGNTVDGNHRIIRTVALTDDEDYTYSIFLKSAELSKFRLSPSTNTGASPAAFFDLELGAIISQDSGSNARIHPFGNGWFRCSIEINAGTGGTTNFMRFDLVNDAGEFLFVGSTTSGLYAWGAQLESTSKATSYVRTDSSTSTRAKDDLEVASTSYNQQQGTLFTESINSEAQGVFPEIATLSDGTTNNRISIRINDNNNKNAIFLSTSNVTQNNSDGSLYPFNSKNKIALTFKAGVVTGYLNAAQDISGTYSVLPSSPLGLKVGQRADGANQFSGHISKVILFNYALTADEVKAL